jgi:hypothetical protein
VEASESLRASAVYMAYLGGATVAGGGGDGGEHCDEEEQQKGEVLQAVVASHLALTEVSMGWDGQAKTRARQGRRSSLAATALETTSLLRGRAAAHTADKSTARDSRTAWERPLLSMVGRSSQPAAGRVGRRKGRQRAGWDEEAGERERRRRGGCEASVRRLGECGRRLGFSPRSFIR